jgi:hypothetical protein
MGVALTGLGVFDLPRYAALGPEAQSIGECQLSQTFIIVCKAALNLDGREKHKKYARLDVQLRTEGSL